jgi:hypothetical protein
MLEVLGGGLKLNTGPGLYMGLYMGLCMGLWLRLF